MSLPALGTGLKAIVFDFDGVILESNHVKADTFRRLFAQYPQHAEAIVKLHRGHGGMPRRQKLGIICRDILGEPADEARLAELSAEFGRLADRRIMDCPFTPGAFEFIQLCSRRYELFIASGTPETEMRDVARRRGLGRYFSGVYGSPRNKGEILRDLMTRRGWRPGELVFIGDSIDDWHGAQSTGVPFIGRAPEGHPHPFPQNGPLLLVPDLAALHRRWGELAGD